MLIHIILHPDSSSSPPEFLSHVLQQGQEQPPKQDTIVPPPHRSHRSHCGQTVWELQQAPEKSWQHHEWKWMSQSNKTLANNILIYLTCCQVVIKPTTPNGFWLELHHQKLLFFWANLNLRHLLLGPHWDGGIGWIPKWLNQFVSPVIYPILPSLIITYI